MSLCHAAVAEPLRLNATLQSENLEARHAQLQLHFSAPGQFLQHLPDATDNVIQSQFVNSSTPTKRHYRLQVEAAGDRFDILLYWPRPNVLSIRVENNWIPGDWILGEVEEALAPLLNKLEKVGVSAQTRLSNADLQLHFSQAPVAGYWSSTGELWWSTMPSAPTLSISPALRVGTQLVLSQSPSTGAAGSDVSATLKHELQIDLPESQVKTLTLSGEKIYDRLASLGANLKGKSTFKGTIAKGQPLTGVWQGHFQADLDRLKVKGKTYSGLRSFPFHWRWHLPYLSFNDFEIWPERPPLPPLTGKYAPRFSTARLQYTIDGPTYLKSLREAVTRARHRVQQEVFVFYPGESTRALSRLYWLKAAGLRDVQQQLVPDTYAPEGIAIEIMHNHLMSPEGAAEVNTLFSNTRSEIIQQLRTQGFTRAQIDSYTQRMQRHFQLRALTRGIIKINHRKQVIIDNSLAFVGGFNMADHYLTEQGFHDIMYQLTGPIVKPLQQAFALNWQALNSGADPFAPQALTAPLVPGQPLRKAQSDALMQTLPRSHTAPFYTPEVALLLHDHDQNTIKPALLQLIGNAKHTLRLEQAYLAEHDIMQALKKAKARGVNLELVMSFYNDEAIFERVNLASMLSLHRAPGAGKIDTWLYRGRDKNRQTPRTDASYMVHSKYISADGAEAIVGSTNLIPRSLQSPFYGLRPEAYTSAPVLFNEELGLWIKDRATVTALDHDLIKRDQNMRSQHTSALELQQLLNARGGVWKLLGDRLKALLS